MYFSYKMPVQRRKMGRLVFLIRGRTIIIPCPASYGIRIMTKINNHSIAPGGSIRRMQETTN
jgi:hypothetical protein